MAIVTIDGRKTEAPLGTTIMEAAREINIHIPSLCSNEELNPYGACRICMVEITQGSRTRMVASCIYEVADGLEVKTSSERVLKVRRLVIELLLARNPNHPALTKIARGLGIENTSFPIDFKGCILCGQCVRTCQEVVGALAIGFESRGNTRKVTTPFGESSPDCIACGACAFICPVQVIFMEEKDGMRKIWDTEFPLQKCNKCGQYFAPKKQLEYFRKIANLPEDHFDTCIGCR